MKPGERIVFGLSATGKPLTMTWRPNPDPALLADRYGAGNGVYLDPAEQLAAQCTAELLLGVRRAAGERVVRLAVEAAQAQAWRQAGAAIRRASSGA